MGLFDFLGGKKDSGRDVGNALNLNAEDEQLAKGQLAKLLNYQDDPNIVDPLQGSRTATQEVMNNPLLGQIFGSGGTMGRTAQEEQELASRGYSLKPEDHEAYGQASDQIAREFGLQEGNLAQALASRGLSSSNMAGQSFSGLQGNKMERLGQMQRQIANDRMQTNLARLGQTRQFLSGLTSQAGTEIGRQNDRQMGAADTQFNRLQSKNSAAQDRLEAQSKQANENMAQRMGSEKQMGWASGLQGLGNWAEQNMQTAAMGGFGGGGLMGAGGAMSNGAALQTTPKPKTKP